MTKNALLPVIAKLTYHLFTVLVGASLGGSDGRESSCDAGDPDWIPESGNALEKEMATHSRTLAWKTPWTEEPGGLQSTGVTKSRTRLGFELTCVESLAFPPFLGALALAAGFFSLS